ncbi:hypothetical protein [Streptomyces sp. NPDC046727]
MRVRLARADPGTTKILFTTA